MQLVRLVIELRQRFHRRVFDPRDIFKRHAPNRHPPQNFPCAGGLVELFVQGANEFIDDFGAGERFWVLLIGTGSKDRGDTAQTPHHLVEHLGGEIKHQIELVGIAFPGKQHPVPGPDPVFTGDKRQIGQNAEFDRPDVPGFLGPEAIIVRRKIS